MSDSGARRLVVIPSNPISVFENAGLEGMREYYNPTGLFDEVFVLSPFELGNRRAHGMTIRRVAERDFCAALRDLQPAVVRAYGGHWPGSVACRNRVDGIPVLVSVHDTHADMLHSTVRYADLVLCVSAAVERVVLARGTDPGRIRRLPNRVDLEQFRPIDDRAVLDRVGQRFPPGRYILHVGRKAPQKNIDTMIAALARLPEEYAMVFVGQGETAAYRQLAQRYKVAQRCHWIESIRNFQLPAWYCWCDVMCVPSRWEGFGVVFIEAAACGAAIITSDIGPMNEFLTHGRSAHLVADYENPETLAAAIRQVAEDRSYREKLSAGAISAAGPFDRTRIDELEAGIYREALELSPRRMNGRERLWLKGHALGQNLRRLPRAPAKAARLTRAAWQKWVPPVGASRNEFSCPDEHVSAALAWIARHELPSGGIRVDSRQRRAHAKVTGYLVPTLLDRGQNDLACRLVEWLVRAQNLDGSFPDPHEGNPSLFDTGQALRGLLAGGGLVPDAVPAARKAVEYLISQMADGGRDGFPPQYEGTIIPETILLYVLEPIRAAAKRFGEPSWHDAAGRCLDFYLGHPQLLDSGRLTHFLAYELEALCDLGRAEAARGVLDELEKLQREDGSLRGRDGVQWVCVPGLAQLAVSWYKIGRAEPADRAVQWVRKHQRPSGGLLGSLGRGADYFPRQEIAWAVKYFLDADRLHSMHGASVMLDRHEQRQ